MEASKPPDTEFKTMVIRMLKEFSENFREISENFNNMNKGIDGVGEKAKNCT